MINRFSGVGFGARNLVKPKQINVVIVKPNTENVVTSVTARQLADLRKTASVHVLSDNK